MPDETKQEYDISKQEESGLIVVTAICLAFLLIMSTGKWVHVKYWSNMEVISSEKY